MGCRFLLQGIFLTQGSNLSLLRWQADSLPPSLRAWVGICYASLSSRPCPHRPLQASSKISLLQRILPHLPRQARSPVLSISSRSFSKKCHYSDYNLFTAVCHIPFCCESMKAVPVSLIPFNTPSMEPRQAQLDSWVLSKRLLGEMTQRTPQL